MLAPWSGLRSTCQAPAGPTTRQPPNSSESGKAAVPRGAAARTRRGGRRDVAGHGEVEVEARAGPPEQAVADRAADEPGVAARERPAEQVERGGAGAHAAPTCSRGTRAPMPHVTS